MTAQKMMLVAIASVLSGSAVAKPVELINGHLLSHAVPAVPTAVRLLPANPLPLPLATSAATTVEIPDPHPQYQFGYSVADPLSGDAKAREETRDGNVVTGSYSVADPDGRIRTVTYTADDVNGFQATVTYDGAPGPVAIPINAQQPTVSAVREVVTSAPVVTAAAPVRAVETEYGSPVAAPVDNDEEIFITRVTSPELPLLPAPAPAPAVANFLPSVVREVPLSAAPAPAVPSFVVREFPTAIHHPLGHTTVRQLPVNNVAVHRHHNVTPLVSTAVRSGLPLASLAANGPLVSFSPQGQLDFSQFRFISSGDIIV